ncbi:hypothetical protein IWX49DRAFT_622328 [Phyllosticta citricarpa]
MSSGSANDSQTSTMVGRTSPPHVSDEEAAYASSHTRKFTVTRAPKRNYTKHRPSTESARARRIRRSSSPTVGNEDEEDEVYEESEDNGKDEEWDDDDEIYNGDEEDEHNDEYDEGDQDADYDKHDEEDISKSSISDPLQSYKELCISASSPSFRAE